MKEKIKKVYEALKKKWIEKEMGKKKKSVKRTNMTCVNLHMIGIPEGEERRGSNMQLKEIS